MKWKNNNDFTGSSKKSMTSEMCNRLKNLTIAIAIIWINFGVILICKKKWQMGKIEKNTNNIFLFICEKRFRGYFFMYINDRINDSLINQNLNLYVFHIVNKCCEQH